MPSTTLTSFPKLQKLYTDPFFDDCLTGASDSKSALLLQQQLTILFSRGGFMLRKWNSLFWRKSLNVSEIHVKCIPFPKLHEYSRTLGIEWNSTTDVFRLNVAKPVSVTIIAKRNIMSDVAKVFDALSLFSPVTIKMKILLQRLWEMKIG